MNGPHEFVSKSDKVSKSYLLEVYHVTTSVFYELIESQVVDSDKQKHLKQLHSLLFSSMERQNLEDGMNSYRAFVIEVLSSVVDETHKIFAIMIQKLVPLVSRNV